MESRLLSGMVDLCWALELLTIAYGDALQCALELPGQLRSLFSFDHSLILLRQHLVKDVVTGDLGVA